MDAVTAALAAVDSRQIPRAVISFEQTNTCET